ncbi:unnamed protein product [Arctogadus glacialis]
MVSSQSRLDASGDLPFPRRAPSSTTDRLTVVDVLGLGPRQRVGVIEVKVLQLLDNKVVQIQGASVALKRFEVCDATGQTTLSVWDRLISTVQLGQCYAFLSLTTRKDVSHIILITTPSTLVTATAGVGQPSSLQLVTVTAEETLRGPVTGVQIVAKPRCPRCHAGQDQLAINSSTHRCERCSILQRTPAYLVTYSGVLIVAPRDVKERSMALTNSAVMGLVMEFCVACNAHEGQALEETIMALPELVVSVNAEGLVVRFAPAGRKRGYGRMLPGRHSGRGGGFDVVSKALCGFGT